MTIENLMAETIAKNASYQKSVLDQYLAVAEEKRSVDDKLSNLRRAMVAEGLQVVTQCIERYQLTAEDLKEVLPPPTPSNSFQKIGSSARRSYRDPTTGKIWNGHGKRPNWLLEHGPDACLIT
jgi:DNA-binding protein H-NS